MTDEEREAMRQLDEVVQIREDMRTVFGGEVGARVLEYLKTENYFYYSTIKPGDPQESNVREGRRQCILDILAMREPVDRTALLMQIRQEIQARDPITSVLGAHVPPAKG